MLRGGRSFGIAAHWHPVLRIYIRPLTTSRTLTVRLLPPRLANGIMGPQATTPRRSDHSDSVAFGDRSDRGFQWSTSSASCESDRRRVNHNRLSRLKMFSDGHLDSVRA